jgi:thioesterase domain-containing protein
MLEATPSTLILKRPITVKVIVTPLWQEEAQKQLQLQVNQIDQQMQQLDMQGQKAIAEIQKQATVQASQQIDNIQIQVNQKKNEMLQKKNQLLQQMQQIQLLELGQEVVQAQMESFFELKQGDNLVDKLNVEIVVRDGVVEEIRGKI